MVLGPVGLTTEKREKMKKKDTKNTNTPNMSVFHDMYHEKNPLKLIRRYFRQRKWARQRAARGYADCDVWDIRGWFLGVFPAMLDQMAEEAHGYPVFPGRLYLPEAAEQDAGTSAKEEKETEINFEEWQALLHRMAQKFRDADEDMCSMKNPYDNEWSQAYDEFTKEYGPFGRKLEKEAIHRKDPSIRMHFPDEFPQWKGVMDKYREKETEIAKFRQKSLDEAMELFHKWFWNLWD